MSADDTAQTNPSFPLGSSQTSEDTSHAGQPSEEGAREARRRWRARGMFEPRDLWVGVFWDRRSDGLHVYVCPVPTLVLHAVRSTR